MHGRLEEVWRNYLYRPQVGFYKSRSLSLRSSLIFCLWPFGLLMPEDWQMWWLIGTFVTVMLVTPQVLNYLYRRDQLPNYLNRFVDHPDR